MPFSLLLALLSTLIAAEYSEPIPAERPLVVLVAVLLLASVAPLYATFIRRRTIADRRRDHATTRIGLRKLRAFFDVVWMAATAVIVFGTSWCQVVRVNWRLADGVLVDELLILAPVFLPLLLAWSILQNAGSPVGIRLGAPGIASSWFRTMHEMWQLARDHLLVLLAPVLLLIAINDLIKLTVPSWLDGGWDGWLFAPVLVAMFCGLPLLLRYIWQTEPLPPGPLRDRLQNAARGVGIEVRHIRVWNTGGAIANAAVTGMSSAMRHVFLTDRLVRHLTPLEIEAVFLHELGHIRYRHLPLRAATVLLPVCAWVAIAPGPLTAQPGLVGAAVLLVAAAYVWWVFGAFSQRLERQADLFACNRLAVAAALPGQIGRPDLSSAVATYTGALEHLAALNGIDCRKNTWQHGRVADRVAWLRDMQRRPLAVQRFQSRLRVVGSVVFGLIVAMAAHLCGAASVWAY